MDLFEGFGVGAVNTPFYNDLLRQGGFVLASESFNLLEEKDVGLDVPCDVSPDQELSKPLQLCGGCESSRAALEGGDLGFGAATQVQRGESRGQFDDNEDEATSLPTSSSLSRGDRSVLSIPRARQAAPVRKEVAAAPGKAAVHCEVDLETAEGHGTEDETVDGEGTQGAPQKKRGDRQDDVVGSSKKQKTKAPKSVGEKRKGTDGEQDHPGNKCPASKQKQPASGPSSPRLAIDVDAGYFLEYKDSVRTKREFEISPAQVVDLGEWEDLYNQRSLDPLLVEGIKEAMWLTIENKEQKYELPTLKLALLGLQEPTPRNKAQRLKPEEWKDELAGQYYYYAVCGQRNAATARSLLDSEVAKKYNFERWPTRMVYFSDNDFEGYFLVSSLDKKKDLKAPPRQLKLSIKEIRWQWKHNVFPRAVMGNPNGKQEQVWKWCEFCTMALHKTPYNNLWILADQKGEDAIKKQNVALRSYFPLAMAGENVWKLAGSPSLAKLGKLNWKLNVQEMVQLVKCDHVLVRLWNYYQFKHEKKPDEDWIQKYPFLKSKSAVFKKFKNRVLDDDLWDGSRKCVSDAALFMDYPPYMGCGEDQSIEATKKLASHRNLTVDWRNKVLSVLTGSRLKSREITLAEGIVHIKWKDTRDVTSIAPFDNDPLEADVRSAELKEAVTA
ncbi:hypothetical protein CBR_g53823 [Chara braunii]|uniref:Uncharacterized protein n=1 Tax=Chara braunii TaxID=69332 RepID=A0A388K742_CHABU|nr:hypothetical protein CBR_g53823 [Chara braunii]|eukprot:GBG65851.1 hypothetical protein CBR_g53823 [Chara braunii]